MKRLTNQLSSLWRWLTSLISRRKRRPTMNQENNQEEIKNVLNSATKDLENSDRLLFNYHNIIVHMTLLTVLVDSISDQGVNLEVKLTYHPNEKILSLRVKGPSSEEDELQPRLKEIFSQMNSACQSSFVYWGKYLTENCQLSKNTVLVKVVPNEFKIFDLDEMIGSSTKKYVQINEANYLDVVLKPLIRLFPEISVLLKDVELIKDELFITEIINKLVKETKSPENESLLNLLASSIKGYNYLFNNKLDITFSALE